MKNENGSVTLGEGDVWNVGSDTVGHMAKLTGSDSNIRRGYINMGSKDLTIDKYSGNATFVYGHDESSPENLTGGKVIIKSAEPLTIYSEGIGDSGSTQTVSSTIDSTITVATSAAGITDTDTAKRYSMHWRPKPTTRLIRQGNGTLRGLRKSRKASPLPLLLSTWAILAGVIPTARGG